MSDVVVVPRLDLEAGLADISAAVDVAVRRLGYDASNTELKNAATAFVRGSDVFVSLPTGEASHNSLPTSTPNTMMQHLHNKYNTTRYNDT